MITTVLTCLLILGIGFCEIAFSFVLSPKLPTKTCKYSSPQNGNEGNSKNPLAGIVDLFSNMDDVVDDFFYKRMGKGEIFYGKRKYKPSGDVEGSYNGFGLSDKLKIDMTREYRDEWLEEKKMRDEINALKRERDERMK